MDPFEGGWAEADIEAALQGNDPNVLLHVPILVSLSPPNCDWSFEICLKLSAHDDPRVRGNAVLGLGHLARMCGALNEAKVRPIVEAALLDDHEDVSGPAYDAASDIDFFLKWSPPLLPTIDDLVDDN